jgi:pyruvate/2-oxoglutarate/acetoin dehydrogenase E1 component
MTKAAAFYNTLLQADEPALVIEPLNGYRTKERMPLNFGEFTEALGVPEIVQQGTDLTLVSYGSTFNICEQAVAQLSEFGVSVELIDAQTLLPFDIHHVIGASVAKTNALLIVDEDVSSGASAFMLDQILVKQGAYNFLDLAPQTMAAKDHRPAYGSDGDYFSKPNFDDIIEKVLDMMHDLDPQSFPKVYE